jgi:hypothetical protein
MVGGRLVACGTLEELAARTGVGWNPDGPEAPIDRIYRALITGYVDRRTALRVVTA